MKNRRRKKRKNLSGGGRSDAVGSGLGCRGERGTDVIGIFVFLKYIVLCSI